MGIQYPVHDLRDHPWYYAFLIIAKHYFYSFFCLRCGCILVPETFFDKSPDSGGCRMGDGGTRSRMLYLLPAGKFPQYLWADGNAAFFPRRNARHEKHLAYYRRERCNTNLKGFIAYTEAAR